MKLSLLIYLIALSLKVLSQPPLIQWEKTYGGTEDDRFNSIVLTNDNNVVLIGSTKSSNGYITTNHGNHDAWLVKIDLLGNLIWNYCFGGLASERGYSLKQTYDSGYVIIADAGYNNGQVSGAHWAIDYWVIKTDSLGLIQWKKCYGGSGDDQGRSIIQTSDSGYLVVGESNSSDFDVTGTNLNGDMWALKLSQDSSILWSKTYGGSHADGADGKRSCIQTADGNYLVVSNVLSNDGNVSVALGGADIWVTKLSPTGQLLREHSYGGSGLDNGFAILPAANNGFVVCGATSSNDGDVTASIGSGDLWLFKADSSGTIIWEKCYGGISLDEANAMCSTNDGGYALAGYASYNSGQVSGVHGYYDYWVVKVDSMGNLEWGKALGGTGRDEAFAIVQTPDGGYVVAGSTESNDGDVSLNLGLEDAWVVKLSPAGMNIKDPAYSIMDLAILQSENNINLRFFSKHNQQSQIVVYNITGQKIFDATIEITEGINYYSLPQSFAKGIYSLQIKGKGFSESKKFIVQ